MVRTSTMAEFEEKFQQIGVVMQNMKQSQEKMRKRPDEIKNNRRDEDTEMKENNVDESTLEWMSLKRKQNQRMKNLILLSQTLQILCRFYLAEGKFEGKKEIKKTVNKELRKVYENSWNFRDETEPRRSRSQETNSRMFKICLPSPNHV